MSPEFFRYRTKQLEERNTRLERSKLQKRMLATSEMKTPKRLRMSKTPLAFREPMRVVHRSVTGVSLLNSKAAFNIGENKMQPRKMRMKQAERLKSNVGVFLKKKQKKELTNENDKDVTFPDLVSSGQF